jgi:hypothetical protein
MLIKVMLGYKNLKPPKEVKARDLKLLQSIGLFTVCWSCIRSNVLLQYRNDEFGQRRVSLLRDLSRTSSSGADDFINPQQLLSDRFAHVIAALIELHISNGDFLDWHLSSSSSFDAEGSYISKEI